MAEVTQKTGSFFQKLKDHIPTTSKIIAIILLILNIFFPGVGTMIMACIGGTFTCEHIVVGLCQMLLAFLIIGWIWSVLWGVFIVLKSSG